MSRKIITESSSETIFCSGGRVLINADNLNISKIVITGNYESWLHGFMASWVLA